MNQKATIGYSFMALLTIGGERVFSMVSFQCPCNHDQNFAYGLTFLLGPAAVLLVLGLFFSIRFWRLYTGCCLNPMKLCPSGNCFGCLRVLVSIFTGACVAPIMWLSVALLNGTFYECAVSGVNDNVVVNLFCKNKTMQCRHELARVPCDRSKLSKDERMELLLMFRAQSQVWDTHSTWLRVSIQRSKSKNFWYMKWGLKNFLYIVIKQSIKENKGNMFSVWGFCQVWENNPGDGPVMHNTAQTWRKV